MCPLQTSWPALFWLSVFFFDSMAVMSATFVNCRLQKCDQVWKKKKQKNNCSQSRGPAQFGGEFQLKSDLGVLVNQEMMQIRQKKKNCAI